MNSPGRREQNKLRTRQAIRAAATRLFDERGFESTTVRDIAAAAGIGERTFFRYFPSKEALASGQVRDLIPDLSELLRARPAHETPYLALRNAVIALAAQKDAPPALFTIGNPDQRPLATEPVTRTDRYLLSDLERAVTEAMADRLAAAGEPEERLRLRAAVKARAGVSALRGLIAVRSAPDAAPAALSVQDFTQLVTEAFSALTD